MSKIGLKRKDAGVVDRGGLDNRCTLTGTKGSNPFLSAGNVFKIAACSYFLLLLRIKCTQIVFKPQKSLNNCSISLSLRRNIKK